MYTDKPSEDESSEDESLGEDQDSTEPELFDSNLELLYESFEYEDGVSQASTTEDREKEIITPQHGTVAVSVFSKLDAPSYQGAPVTILQSSVLIFQYATRHCLSGKGAFTATVSAYPLCTEDCT